MLVDTVGQKELDIQNENVKWFNVSIRQSLAREDGGLIGQSCVLVGYRRKLLIEPHRYYEPTSKPRLFVSSWATDIVEMD